MSDIAPGYPAIDVTPGAPAPTSGGGGGGGRRGVRAQLRGLLKTRNGRVSLAVAAGLAIAAALYLRSRATGTAPLAPAAPLPTATSDADMLAGIGPAPVSSTTMPDGGFDFQNFDPGPVEPIRTVLDDNGADITPAAPPISVVVNVPPAAPASTIVAPIAAVPTPATVLKPNRKGYYRSGWSGGFRYEDGKGHASGIVLDAARTDNVRMAGAEMRVRLKKNPAAGPVAFDLYAITHWMHNDGTVDPK